MATEEFDTPGLQDADGVAETRYLNSIPGLVRSILEAAREPLEEGTLLEDLEW